MMAQVFAGCMPALMTPCRADRSPDYDGLVRKAKELVETGMSAVVYCGSMGDWPLLTDDQRMTGVARLVEAGVPVVVGTGAVNTASAVSHAAHAARVGASGLMLIPRVLSRGSAPAAQKTHFQALLSAAPGLPAVIYNSPYYGFATRSELFFALRAEHPNLVGFKEFGGAGDLSYAAEHITSADPDVALMVGVDTAVYHGVVRCGAVGAITGIGNVIPREVLLLFRLCQMAAEGNEEARRRACELDEAMAVLSGFDEGPDLVLYYKHLMVLTGHEEYRAHFNPTDALSDAQRNHATQQFEQFRRWFDGWMRLGGVISACF
ncbi:MAG: dihydrodipicolinate synthase family protein [Pseudomonadota bacterium]